MLKLLTHYHFLISEHFFRYMAQFLCPFIISMIHGHQATLPLFFHLSIFLYLYLMF
jgi:hypothetical protein